MASTLTIELQDIRQNVQQVKEFIGSEVSLAAVIKADAYGLGAAGVAMAMIEGGADLLAVARYSEAEELNRLVPSMNSDILIMGLSTDEELVQQNPGNILYTIDSLRQAKILSQKNDNQVIHVKLDTGFGRIGLKASNPHAFDEYREICALPGIKISGLFSHLALKGKERDQEQFSQLTAFTDKAKQEELPTGIIHICDSIALSRYPQYHLNMVRAGAILYGMRPLRTPQIDNLAIKATFHWTTKIIHISSLNQGEGLSYDCSWKAPSGGARIATLPVGYADGYKRALSNKGLVCIHGKKCPIVGVICMDQMMVDISSAPDAKIGEKVFILGEKITIEELAEKAGTNRNDILASIGRRVNRVYLDHGKIRYQLNYMQSPSYRSIENDRT